jgi:recombination associated protein RdgC
MFKHVTLYRIAPGFSLPPLDKLDEELQRLAFQPCGPTQALSGGWLPPRGHEHGAMVEQVGGQLILKLAIERKAVPSAAVKAEVEARCKAIEQERGRKPGRKEKAEIKDEVVLTLLPRAFSKRAAFTIWMDPEARLLVVGVGSMRAAEPVLKNLVDVMAELGHVLPLAPISTATAPATAMAEWLTAKEAPAGFTIDRELELKKAGEDRSVVRYSRHSLDLDEIGEHIRQGKMPTHLSLTWNDKVSFVLTEGFAIRKIDIRGIEEAPKGEDGFDADVAITTGELQQLVPDLLAALGGELVVEAQTGEMTAAAASPAGPAAPGQSLDDLFARAIVVVRENQRPSISLVQRHLKIGYNRAAQLLEDMETRGLVSAMDNSGQRRCLPALAQA